MSTSESKTTDVSETALEQLISRANVEFEEMCAFRHERGETEYGHNTFMQAPTLQMALEELVDLSNYARYTFIKIRVLMHSLDKEAESRIEEPFIPASRSSGFTPSTGGTE